jgi:uncharacterized cofD-like protein
MKVYFVNLMWQPGETIDLAASDHVKAIHNHADCDVIDCVVVNAEAIPARLQKKYARAHVQPVVNDFTRLTKMGVKVVTADLIGEEGAAHQKIRHDSDKLAGIVVDLASRSRAHQTKKLALSMAREQVRRKRV